MKKRIAIFAFVVIVILLYNHYRNLTPRLELLMEQRGGIHNFYIEGDKVYIVCGVTVRNNTDTKIAYSLEAISEDDYNSGLLKSEKLEGYDETIENNIFSINGKEVQTFIVVFVGEHGGYPRKKDRLAPEIVIHEITE